MSEEGKFSFSSLRLLGSWVDQLMYCRNQLELNPNHKNTTELIGSFKFTYLYDKELMWTTCGFDNELIEIISHYLKFNLTFIKPNSDFDGTLGWHNETHSNGPMKMFQENQIDFILNPIFISKNIWQPNLYQFSTGLMDEYTINFALRKQIFKTSILDYFNTFNMSIWLLILGSILLVSIVQTLISFFGLKNNFNYSFCFKLIFDYLKLLVNSPSKLISELLPRHYIMYFIPLLSIMLIALFQNIIYSKMIVPRKYWCQDLDCFAKSNLKFYTFNNAPSLNLLKQKEEWQFKMIMSKLTIGPPRCKLIKSI